MLARAWFRRGKPPIVLAFPVFPRSLRTYVIAVDCTGASFSRFATAIRICEILVAYSPNSRVRESTTNATKNGDISRLDGRYWFLDTRLQPSPGPLHRSWLSHRHIHAAQFTGIWNTGCKRYTGTVRGMAQYGIICKSHLWYMAAVCRSRLQRLYGRLYGARNCS